MLEKLWFSTLLRGVVTILFGLSALFWPGLTLSILIMVFGAFAVIEGFSLIGGGMAFRNEHLDWWLPVVTGVAVVILGLIAFLWPGLTGLFVLVLIAFRFMIVGVTEIMLAIRIRKAVEGEWFLLAQGALSLCLGILLITQPGAGALAVAWLIGTIALFSGVLTVIIALKFRGDLMRVVVQETGASVEQEEAGSTES